MSDLYTTEVVESWLERLRMGDRRAVGELIRSAQNRLRRIAESLRARFPVVARWEDTDDVCQNASLRLVELLDRETPADAAHFFRLSARIMRRQLIDLARRYRGPASHAAHHATAGPAANRQSRFPQAADAVVTTHDPQKLMQWTHLHEAVETLPDELRDVFELMYYHGFKQVEVQKLLGCDSKTVRKRWLRARLVIQKALDEHPV